MRGYSAKPLFLALTVVGADVLNQHGLVGFIFPDVETHDCPLGHQLAEAWIAANTAAQLGDGRFRCGAHLGCEVRTCFKVVDQYLAFNGETFVQQVGVDRPWFAFVIFFGNFEQVFVQVVLFSLPLLLQAAVEQRL